MIMPFVCLPFFLLALPSPTAAFVAFKPNCTIPPKIVNYVSNPQVRGTLQILWGCITVLLLCTWSIQHASVPIEHDKSKPPSRVRRLGLQIFSGFVNVFHRIFGWKQQPRLWNEFFDEVRWNWDRLIWMGAVILCPEFHVGKALTENYAANESRKAFPEEDEWTTMHGFFANMRGFVMRFETTAVQTRGTSLKPGKPTKEGRALAKPGLTTVYEEQDLANAEKIELRHCEEKCGEGCPYRRDRKGSEAQWSYFSALKTSHMEAVKRSWYGDHLRMRLKSLLMFLVGLGRTALM